MLQRAHARLDGADAVAQTAGPAVAGALIWIVGAPLAVLVDAVTYLFSAAMVATIPSVPGARPTDTPGWVRALGTTSATGPGGSMAVGAHRLAVATHIWFAAQAVLLVVVAPYSFLQLDLSAFQLGLVYAVAGVGALIGALLSTRSADASVPAGRSSAPTPSPASAPSSC